jgi:hypothetical protein
MPTLGTTTTEMAVVASIPTRNGAITPSPWHFVSSKLPHMGVEARHSVTSFSIPSLYDF